MKANKAKKTTPWAAIIVAASKSKRLKSRVPKPFLYVDNRRTMLDLCLESFAQVPGLSFVIIVTQPNYTEAAMQAIYRWKLSGIVTKGGAEREDSVQNGLAVIPKGVKCVLIHDAARPLIDPGVIRRVLEKANSSGADRPGHPGERYLEDHLRRQGRQNPGPVQDRRHPDPARVPGPAFGQGVQEGRQKSLPPDRRRRGRGNGWFQGLSGGRRPVELQSHHPGRPEPRQGYHLAHFG